MGKPKAKTAEQLQAEAIENKTAREKGFAAELETLCTKWGVDINGRSEVVISAR